MPKTRCKLLQSPKTKNCTDVTKTGWHFYELCFSACTSIKVAALLSKITDLPQEHFSPLDPTLYFQLLFLRLPCRCGRDLFSLPAGPSNHLYHIQYSIYINPNLPIPSLLPGNHKCVFYTCNSISVL